MTGQRLIFTDELMSTALAQPEATRKLLHRWATFPGPAREAARGQLEAAAMRIPLDQRPRMLGPLHSGDDKQVFAAAGVLLLAKVLGDQGWGVEHEPEISGVTPDLRIWKGGANFLVEVRHVAGDFGLPPAYQRVKAALKGIRTPTPASFSRMDVDGRASLKGFKAFIRQALKEQREGTQLFQEPGVVIAFELHHPPLESELEVFFAHHDDGRWFDDRPKVQAALDEKLKKYPFPLIVALQGIETGDLFGAAEDTLFGSEVYVVPVSLKSGAAAGPGYPSRKPDAAVARQDSDGDRVRSRLEALLPFEVVVRDEGFAIRARVLSNPAREVAAGLREFIPIPTLLRLDPQSFSYFGSGGKPLGNDENVPDLFFP